MGEPKAGEDQGSILTLQTAARGPMLYLTLLLASHLFLHMDGMQGSTSQNSQAAPTHQVAAVSCGQLQGAETDIRTEGT